MASSSAGLSRFAVFSFEILLNLHKSFEAGSPFVFSARGLRKAAPREGGQIRTLWKEEAFEAAKIFISKGKPGRRTDLQ